MLVLGTIWTPASRATDPFVVPFIGPHPIHVVILRLLEGGGCALPDSPEKIAIRWESAEGQDDPLFARHRFSGPRSGRHSPSNSRRSPPLTP